MIANFSPSQLSFAPPTRSHFDGGPFKELQIFFTFRWVSTIQIVRPLFSWSYESLFAQTHYFHIHTKPPGVWCLTTRHFKIRDLSASRPFFRRLCTLLLSLRSSCARHALFSITCGLFDTNSQGVGALSFLP